MTSCERLVSVARSRLRLRRAVEALPRTLIVAAIALFAAFLAGKLLPVEMPPWWATVSVITACALAAVAIRALLHPPTSLEAAIEADGVLGLRDRLSIAIASGGSNDPFAQAAVADAERRAADPALRATLRRSLRPEAPHGWWWAIPVLVAAVLVEALVPAISWTPSANAEEATAARDEANEALAELETAIREQPELESALGDSDLLGEEGEDPFKALEDPEEIRLEAIRRMTALEERLESILAGEDAAAAEAMRDALSELDVPAEGLAQELALAMRLGDYEKASQAIEAMRDALEKSPEEGGLTDEEREALAKELEKLAEQLEKLAAERQDLDDALRAAGLDPAQAGELSPEDMQRLREAVQNASNLNESQRQELMKMAQAAQRSQSQSKAMSEAMKQMASQCQGGQNAGEGQFGSEAQQMLSQMESMQQMLKQARAAQSASRARARGLGSQGFMKPGSGSGEEPGPGMGGRGRGRGGVAPRQETETGTEIVREAGVLREGDVIMRTLIEGEIEVGEATLPLERIDRNLEASAPGAAAEEDPVPPHLREAHRHYFGSLKKLVKPAAKPAAEPAETPASGGGA
ncbi:MAG: hypothetical protein RJA16_1163 [Planctomycetota bacterium]